VGTGNLRCSGIRIPTSMAEPHHVLAARERRAELAIVMRGSCPRRDVGAAEGFEVRENVNGYVAYAVSVRSGSGVGRTSCSGRDEIPPPLRPRPGIDGKAAHVYASAEDRKCLLESLDARIRGRVCGCAHENACQALFSGTGGYVPGPATEETAKRPRILPVAAVRPGRQTGETLCCRAGVLYG